MAVQPYSVPLILSPGTGISFRPASDLSYSLCLPASVDCLPGYLGRYADDYIHLLDRSLLTSTSIRMWNDEDNNPYGSFDRRDSNTSDPPNPGSLQRRKYDEKAT